MKTKRITAQHSTATLLTDSCELKIKLKSMLLLPFFALHASVLCVHVWWAFNVCCVEQLGVTKILHHLRWPWNQRHLLIRFVQTVFFFIFFIGESIFTKLIFSTPWHGDWFSDIRTNVERFWYQLNIEQYKLDYVLNRADLETLIIQLCVCSNLCSSVFLHQNVR